MFDKAQKTSSGIGGATSAPAGASAGKSKYSGGVPWRLLMITVLIFGLVILLWAGLRFGYIPYLTSKAESIDSQLSSLSSSLDKAQQEEFTKLYSQLYNIQDLSLSQNYDASKFFDFLESNTYQNVLIKSTRVQVKKGTAQINGITIDYSTLTDQIASYKFHPEVDSVSLDSSSARRESEGGGIDFSIKVVFKKSFFMKK